MHLYNQQCSINNQKLPGVYGYEYKIYHYQDKCGKGFNSFFLAKQYPNVNFTGIDLTPSHIKIAF